MTDTVLKGTVLEGGLGNLFAVPEKPWIKRMEVLVQGHSDLIDYMGSEARIVNAARVSFGKRIDEMKPLKKKDVKLLKYLWDHRHTTPFEMVEFTFRVKVPLFVRAQWHRHRTWNYNELSGRYAEFIMENMGYYIPVVWRKQDDKNKQGSEGEFTPAQNKMLSDRLQRLVDFCDEEYRFFLEEGVAREMARICLPQNMFTEYYAKVDLHNLLHFLRLRLDPHAQWEIREYAKALLELISDIVPNVVKFFKESLDFEV